MLKILEVVEAKELLPIVPVFNYTNKPIVPWKKEANRIKSISELKGQDECLEYVNNNDEVWNRWINYNLNMIDEQLYFHEDNLKKLKRM